MQGACWMCKRVLKTLNVQWKLEAKEHCGPPIKNITNDEIAKPLNLWISKIVVMEAQDKSQGTKVRLEGGKGILGGGEEEKNEEK
jgi:hypothetical protein